MSIPSTEKWPMKSESIISKLEAAKEGDKIKINRTIYTIVEKNPWTISVKGKSYGRTLKLYNVKKTKINFNLNFYISTKRELIKLSSDLKTAKRMMLLYDTGKTYKDGCEKWEEIKIKSVEFLN